MKWIKIILWVVLATIAKVIFGGNILLWIGGVFLCRVLIQAIFTAAFAIIIFILIYVMILGGIFWVLIS